jgi:acyl-CoA hydrolase
MRYVKILLLIFFGSCADSKRVPKQYLQPAQMQQVLMDLLVADAVNSLQISKDTAFKLQEQNRAAAEQVYKSYKITREQFEKSYGYYLSRPDLLQPIADSMAAIANRRSIETPLPTIVPATNTSSTDSLKNRYRYGNYRPDTSKQVRNR